MDKKCCTCKEIKYIELFPIDGTRPSGRGPYCNECKAKRNRDAYKRNPKSFYDSAQKWIKSNPQKRKAHLKIRWAVESGKIIKPNNCENCGKPGKLDAHHHKGYEDEFMLDVQWLCRSCHKQNDV